MRSETSAPQGHFLRGAPQGHFLRGAPQGHFLRGTPVVKKVILYIAQSLDGFVATKDGSVALLDEYQDVPFEDYGYSEFEKSVDTIVQGSTTYDQFKPKYPGKNSYVFSNDADNRREEGVILGKMWFLDRMVWLYEDMKNKSDEYASWEY